MMKSLFCAVATVLLISASPSISATKKTSPAPVASVGGFTGAGSIQLGGSAALSSDEFEFDPYVNFFILDNVFIRPNLSTQIAWGGQAYYAVGPCIGYAYDGGWPFIPAASVGVNLLARTAKDEDGAFGFRLPLEGMLIIPIRPDFSINPALRFNFDSIDGESYGNFSLQVGFTGLIY